MIGKLTLSTVALLLALLSAEAFLELTAPPHSVIEAQVDCRIDVAKQVGIEYDTRSRAKFITRLRESGTHAYPSPYYGLYLRGSFARAREKAGSEILPLAGPSKVPSVLINEGGFHPVYVSDRYGFNNPDSVWDEPTDLMMVGDSYVHGQGVQPGHDMTGQLRELGWRAISAGISDHGPIGELAILKEYGTQAKPKKVVWVYFANDLPGAAQSKFDKPLMRYLEDPDHSQRLVERQSEIDSLVLSYMDERLEKLIAEEQRIVSSELLEQLGSVLQLTRLRQRISSSNQEVKTKTFDAEIQLLSEALQAAKQLVESWGGELYFLHLPDYGRYSVADSNGEHPSWFAARELRLAPLRAERERVLASVSELGLPVFDFDEFLGTMPNAHSYYNLRCPGHFNRNGNSELAKLVDAHLRAESPSNDSG